MSIFNINNLKTIIIVSSIIVAVIFYKDYKFQIQENERQSNNISQLRKLDSFRFASQVYTKQELDQYLEYNRKDLQDYLKQNDIKLNRIEKIITQQIQYQDTINRVADLKPILDAIKKNTNKRVPVVDSTKCLIVKGFVVYENDTLSLNITDRKFKNITDVVSYWEREKYSFLGLWRWRLFGRKIATVITKDDCGKSQTITIDKRNKTLK